MDCWEMEREVCEKPYQRLRDAVAAMASRYGARLDWQEEASSTNDVVRDPAYGHGDAVLAERQTKGRGQRGNRWDSTPGENLTFSMVLHPETLPAGRQFLLSEAVALAVTDMLETYGLEAQVKWTNDIYVAGRKMTGILIENGLSGGVLSRSIVGIGLDVNQTRFEEWIPNPTSMKLLAGHDFDRGEVFERLYEALMKRFAMLCEGGEETLMRDYHARLYLRDVPHRYLLPDGSSFMGIIRRVEPSGRLMVEHPDGTVHGYLFREIAFTL